MHNRTVLLLRKDGFDAVFQNIFVQGIIGVGDGIQSLLEIDGQGNSVLLVLVQEGTFGVKENGEGTFFLLQTGLCLLFRRKKYGKSIGISVRMKLIPSMNQVFATAWILTKRHAA